MVRPALLHGRVTRLMSAKDEKRMAVTEMRMVLWEMGVSLQEHRKLGDFGGSKGGTDSGGREKERVRMVLARQKKRWNRQNELPKWGWRGRSLEEDSGWDGRTPLESTWKSGRSVRIAHWRRKIERSQQDSLPCTRRRWRKVRKVILTAFLMLASLYSSPEKAAANTATTNTLMRNDMKRATAENKIIIQLYRVCTQNNCFPVGHSYIMSSYRKHGR